MKNWKSILHYESQICTYKIQVYNSGNQFCPYGNLSILQKNERSNIIII